MNVTIIVPKGTTNHGNPNLLCTPPNWYDYAIFYLTNYIAHAATVITSPGQGLLETTLVIISALLLPTTGVIHATVAIFRCALFRGNELRRAAFAGALYVVSRDALGGSGEAAQGGKDEGGGQDIEAKKPREGMEREKAPTIDVGLATPNRVETETPGNDTGRLIPSVVPESTEPAKLDSCHDNHPLADSSLCSIPSVSPFRKGY